MDYYRFLYDDNSHLKNINSIQYKSMHIVAFIRSTSIHDMESELSLKPLQTIFVEFFLKQFYKFKPNIILNN